MGGFAGMGFCFSAVSVAGHVNRLFRSYPVWVTARGRDAR